MITLNKDEFEKRYGSNSVKQFNQPVTVTKEEFNKHYGIDDRSFLRKTADFFTESTQKFGQTLGTAASVADNIGSKSTDSLRSGTLQSTQNQIDNYMRMAIKYKDDQEKAKKYLKAAQSLADTEDIDIFNNEEYQKTAKQVFGEGFGTALELMAFSSFGSKGLKAGKLGKAVPTALKPLTFGKDIAKGAKIGAAYGGGFGAGFGATRAMQDNKSTGEIVKSGLIEGGMGATGGAVMGGGISALTQGAVNLTSRAAKLVGVSRTKVGEAAYNKLNKTARDLMKMSPTQTRNEARWGKNSPKFLVDEGVIGLVESDGNRIVTDEAVGALRDKYHAESRAFGSLLKDSGEWVSLDDFERKALSGVKEKFKNRGSDYQKAIDHIKKEVSSYKNNYRDTGLVDGSDVLVDISDFNKIKTGLWSRTSNFNPSQADKLLSDLNYGMGQVAKDLIEDSVEDVAIKRLNQRLGNFASAITVLENANGKVLPGGFFGKAFTRIAGTIAGSGGGIPGSVIGNLTGGMLADIAMNPKIKTSALTKVYNKLGKTADGMNIIDEAALILQKRGNERAARKLLKAPDYIEVGAKTPPESIAKGVDAKATSARDTETGQFKKAYTSEPKNPPLNAFGVFAGMEVDDNGEVTFNPEAAIAGLAVMGITKKALQIKELQKSHNNLNKRLSDTTNKAVRKQLQKAKKAIEDLIWNIRNSKN